MSSRQRLTLVATILASATVFLDSTVVNVALPAIAADLDAGLAEQQWVVEAYLLALVALILVGGALGDRYGRRLVFTIGLGCFAATSALCALAPSAEALVGFRAAQGLAGALLVPGSLALLAAAFEGEARGRAVGAWTAWTGIATVCGPAAGGLLIGELSWRWVFWLNVPLIAATLALTRRAVAESHAPRTPGEDSAGFDLPGVGLSAVGLGAPVFALIAQPDRGFGDPLVLVPLVAGLVALAAFVARESLTRSPMLPLGLFRIRNFAAANAATLAVYAGLIGASFFITLYLQQVAGYSPLEAGLATMPISVLLFALSARFGALGARIGPRLPMTAGPIVAGLGLALMMRVGTDADYLGTVLPAVLVFGLGLSATVAPLTATVLDSVDEPVVGIASGVNNAVARVAGLLAIAVLGAVVSARFGSALDDRLPASGLRGDGLAAVAAARERPLAGAAVASALPPAERERVGAAIELASRDAFRLGTGIGAGLLVAGGVVALAGIRDPRPSRLAPAPLAATACDCGHPAEALERAAA